MATTQADATRIFDDARAMNDAALQRLADGDLRDAAEKAWCATLRAVEALVLARTGQHPVRSTHASRRLQLMADSDPSVVDLRHRYLDRQDALHGHCFYHDFCLMPSTAERIRGTASFIADAIRLTDGPPIPAQDVGP